MEAVRQERTYLGKTPEERRAIRRAALVEAALDCVVDDEVELSVRSICAKSRLTQRYFYEAFPNLDALLVELLTEAGREAFAAGRAAVDAAPRSLHARCRAAFTGTWSVVTRDPRRARLLLVTAAGSEVLDRARRALILEYVGGLLDYLAQELDVDVADSSRARGAALFMVGGVVEMAIAVSARTLRLSEDELADLVADLLASSLVGLSQG